ncbi:MAG: PrsW family intramembrane metalloprotease [Rubrobacter sp.]|nr:PrsW family intramembrane metalloprotease [Rubrobacter sp.]
MSGALVGIGVLQTLVYLAFIRFIDLYEREPLRYVVPVFLWGFTVAVAISLFFNTLFQVAVSQISTMQVAGFLTAVVAAPVVEECAKGFALFLVFLVSYAASRRRGVVEFSGVMDGIVYGSAVGFGFSLAEDLLYYAQFGPETYAVRRIFGGFAHAAFTSMTGIGFGLVPWVRSPLFKPVPPVLGLGVAIGLHAAFNLTASLFGPLAYGVLFLVLLLYAAIIAGWLAFERRAIRDELREEVAAGLLGPEDYSVLPTYFRRTARYLKLALTGRWGEWFRERRLHAAAVDLALAKRVSRSGMRGEDERVDRLRQKLLGLRGELPSPGAGGTRWTPPA